jgi:hypothetical protein
LTPLEAMIIVGSDTPHKFFGRMVGWLFDFLISASVTVQTEDDVLRNPTVVP